MELTTWKSSAKTLQGLWSDSEEKQEQPLSSSSWSFLEALCLALSTYMTIITQSFLTRAFFITIILEAFCNNSEVPGKKNLKCLFLFFFPPSPKIHVSFHCVQSVSVAVAWVSLETAAGQTMIGCVVSLIAVFQAVGPLSAAPKQVNRGLSKGFALVVWKKPHRWHLGECVTQGHWFEENRRQQGMKKKKRAKWEVDGRMAGMEKFGCSENWRSLVSHRGGSWQQSAVVVLTMSPSVTGTGMLCFLFDSTSLLKIFWGTWVS